MRFGQARSQFFLFWAAASAAWTLTWLLVDWLLVPDPLRAAPAALVAIGVATAALPPAVLLAGRGILSLAVRALEAARKRMRDVRAAPVKERREGYQASAGPL